MDKELLAYAIEVINSINGLTEDEKSHIMRLVKENKYDLFKEYVIKLKTKYGYYKGEQ